MKRQGQRRRKKRSIVRKRRGGAFLVKGVRLPGGRHSAFPGSFPKEPKVDAPDGRTAGP